MSITGLVILAFASAVMVAVLRGVRRCKAQAARERSGVTMTFSHQFAAPPGEGQSGGSAPSSSDAFRFSPELFEHRARVIEELEARGFAWFSHYSSVDCLHDVHGVEVCGIRERNDAVSILRILKQMFPDWKPG